MNSIIKNKTESLENKHHIELLILNEKFKNLQEDSIKIEKEIKIYKTSFNEMGKERSFYLSKLKDLEFLFNNLNNIINDEKVKILVNNILYSVKN